MKTSQHDVQRDAQRARGSRWLGGALALVCAASAWGQTVHVVAGDGSGDFLEIQGAVTAAEEGDVILVRPHVERYGFTTIDGKSLTVVGDGGVRPAMEDLRVVNLAADQAVVVRFLDIEGRLDISIFGALQRNGVELISNQGCVWLEDLLVAGANGVPKLGGSEAGLRGLVVQDSACVIAVDSQFFGGSGEHSVAGTADPGGDGALLTGSTVAFHGCTVTGGRGGFGFNSFGGQGGSGVDCTTSEVFASGSSLIGGDTGGTDLIDSTIPTASGLVAREASTVNHLATTFASGAGPAPPGPPIDSTGAPSTVTDLDDAHRALKGPAVVREEVPAELGYTGQPGDLVLLRVSATSGWSFAPALAGVQQLGALPLGVILGVAGPAGTIDVAFDAPCLPPGLPAVTAYVQPLVDPTQGPLRLGAPSSILIVDASIPAP